MLHRLKCLLPKKGSVLVFSLVILALMLVSALSVATVSVSERKAASVTERSSRSFQVADSGVELVLQKIYKGNFTNLNALATSLGTTCNGNGEISATLNSGTYTVSFYDLNNTKFTSADCASLSWRDRLTKIKSEGASGNTLRVVEVAVAATSSGVVTGGCSFGSAWGTATTCGAGAGMACASGNTARIMTYCNPSTGSCSWNSVGQFAHGFCTKD